MDKLIQSTRSQSTATRARAVAAASRVFLQFARSNRSQTSPKLFFFSCKLKGFTFIIKKYIKFTFQPSGVISAYKEYNDSTQNFKIFKPNAVICNKEQLGLKKLPRIGISDDKKKDLLSLMYYLTSGNRKFDSKLFENCWVIDENNESSDDSDTIDWIFIYIYIYFF